MRFRSSARISFSWKTKTSSISTPKVTWYLEFFIAPIEVYRP